MPTHRKLSAILSADAAGYSRLMAQNEDATVGTLNAARDIFRQGIQSHAGRLIDTAGDSVLAEFQSVVEALRCASEVQEALRKQSESVPDDQRMRFRIGVNLGDVIEQEDGTIYGDGVNVAARLQSLADPGGICISGTAYDQVEGKLRLKFKFIGEQRVKNIDRPVRAYQLEQEPGIRSTVRPVSAPSSNPARKVVLVSVAALLVVGAGIGVYNLQRPSSAPTRVGMHRVAVLPFANLSADAENEYFADGITEEMISQLSKIHGLEVIARTSVMTYKGKDKKIDEIGRELRVGAVLEGSVRKAENHVRVTAQLIDVANQAHLWTQDYDRELKGVFAIQSEIARSVAAALKVKLAPAEQQQIDKKRTDNPEAHELYLRGLYYFNKQTKEGFEKSIEYYEHAIKKDPSYAEAYAWLAFAYEIQGWYGLVPEKEAFAKAKAIALRALELDSSNAVAFAVLGDMTSVDWNWTRAEDLYQRSLSVNPNSAMVHEGYGMQYLSPMGRHEEAIAEVKRAVALDPLSAQYPDSLGWVLQLARQYDAAIEQFQKAIQMESTMAIAYRGLGESYAYKGMHEKSIEAIQSAVKFSDGSPFFVASLGWAYGVAGKKDEALKVLDLLKQKAKREPVAPSDFARVYLGLGNKDEALYWLEKTYEERSGLWVLLWANQFPFFDSLRAEPRFKALLKKIGLEN